MPDYSKGKVYRILQDNDKTVYIGSTVQPLSARMAGHRKKAKLTPDRKIYKLMNEVGVDHFSIELVCDFPCERLEQLVAEEGRQVRLHNTLNEGGNHQMPGLSKEEQRKVACDYAKNYAKAHRDEIKAYMTDYRVANKEKIASRANAYMKAYNATNRDAINRQRKASRDANKDVFNAHRKAYRAAHKDEINAYKKAYRDAHKDEINTRQKEAYAHNRDLRKMKVAPLTSESQPEPVAS